MDKIRSKRDCNDGSKVNGLREPIFISFQLFSGTPWASGFSGNQRQHVIENLKKSVLKNNPIYLDDEYKTGGPTALRHFPSMRLKKYWFNTYNITSKNKPVIDKKISMKTLSELKPLASENYDFQDRRNMNVEWSL